VEELSNFTYTERQQR